MTAAELDALDAGLIDVGMTASEAMERIERLEAKLAAMFAYMGETAQQAGLPGPQEATPARHLRLVR